MREIARAQEREGEGRCVREREHVCERARARERAGVARERVRARKIEKGQVRER